MDHSKKNRLVELVPSIFTRGPKGGRVGCPNEPFQLCDSGHTAAAGQPRGVGWKGCRLLVVSKTAGGFLQLWGGLGNHFPPNQQLIHGGFLAEDDDFCLDKIHFLRGRVVENQIFVAVFGML